MPEVSEYELFMKMLEIIEIRHKHSAPPTDAEKDKITTIIKNIEGNLLLVQDPNQEVSMHIEGDRFENVANSVIATRGAIASGIIKVRESDGDEVADALQQLEKAIAQADPQAMSKEDKQKALKLLEELTKQVSSPSRAKVVLEAMGKGLWEIIRNVEPLAKTVSAAWAVIQKLWS